MVVHVAPTDEAQDAGKIAPALAYCARRTSRQLDQVKGVFLASLNHEIRTPLSGIMGMLDLLLETGIDEDQRDYLNAARLCAESLSELLNSSLEYAALEAGQISLEETEFSVKEMLEAAMAQQRSKADVKQLRLRLTLDAGLPETLIGDASRLRELLGHLVNNAIKFTHTGSVDVRVSMRASDDAAARRAGGRGARHRNRHSQPTSWAASSNPSSRARAASRGRIRDWDWAWRWRTNWPR